MRIIARTILCSALLFGASSAMAADVLQPQHYAPTGVDYVTGGIGLAERTYLESVKSDYSLEIEAALTSREFIADVAITITNAKKEVVLEAMMDGPWLYAALPEGSYTITAHYGADEKSQRTQISKGLREVLFVWKAEPQADVPAPARRTPAVRF